MVHKRGTRPKPYNIKPIETRGMVGKELQPVRSFWKHHTMDEIITLSPEELDAKIEQFYDDFEARNIKGDPNWKYKDIPIKRG